MAVGEIAPETVAVPENVTDVTPEDIQGQLINLPGQVRMKAHERRAAFHTRQVESPLMHVDQRETERRMAEHHIWELHEKFPFSELVQPL